MLGRNLMCMICLYSTVYWIPWHQPDLKPSQQTTKMKQKCLSLPAGVVDGVLALGVNLQKQDRKHPVSTSTTPFMRYISISVGYVINNNNGQCLNIQVMSLWFISRSIYTCIMMLIGSKISTLVNIYPIAL